MSLLGSVPIPDWPEGLDKATLLLCSARVCRLVLAEAAHFRQCHHAVNILMLWASAMEHG